VKVVSMVKSIIDLTERENRIINIVKAKYGLKDKSQALSIILKRYEECELEPHLRPELVDEIEETRKNGKFVKVKDFAKEFDVK
jgi:hypothetical protein